MALTLGDAETARRGVLATWGAQLPGNLAADLAAKAIGDTYQLLPLAAYRVHFNAVFKHMFAAANVVALGRARVIKPSAPAPPGPFPAQLNQMLKDRMEWNAHAALRVRPSARPRSTRATATSTSTWTSPARRSEPSTTSSST